MVLTQLESEKNNYALLNPHFTSPLQLLLPWWGLEAPPEEMENLDNIPQVFHPESFKAWALPSHRKL